MSHPAVIAKRSSTPGRHVYDVVIFGGQLGGALCAAVLAKRGLKVLLLEHDGLGTPYVHADYTFSYAPFLTGALEKIAPLEAMLSEIGVAAQLKRASHASGLQLLRPRQWLELFPELGARSKELSRALGDAAAETFIERLDEAHKTITVTEPFFQSHPDLPPDGWFARWKAKRHLAGFSGFDTDTSLDAKDPLQALVRALGRFCATADGPIARSRELARLLPTPHTFPGGAEGLRTTLADRARELGADVIDADQQLELIAFEGNKAVGVRLRRHETIYRGGAIIAACDLSTLAPLVPEQRRAPLQKLTPLLPFTKALFTTHAVLPERQLPRGLGALGVIESADPELGPVLFSVSNARKGGAETSERVLSFTVPAPIAVRSAGEPAVQALTGRVWAAVRDVFPFTRQHVTLTSSPWTDVPRVVAGLVEPWPCLELPDTSELGIVGVTTTTPWGRLFNASRQVLPGLGLEGEALAAQRAIAAVEKLLDRKDPLKSGRAS